MKKRMSVKYLAIFIAFSSLIGFYGCEEVNNLEPLGTWEYFAPNGDTEYLDITEQTFTFVRVDNNTQCASTSIYDIVQRDGEFFTVAQQNNPDNKILFAVSRDRNIIEVKNLNQNDDEVKTYFQTNDDLDNAGQNCTFNVYGFWERNDGQGLQTWLSITEEKITVADYFEQEDCHFVQEIKILNIEGSTFRVEITDPFSQQTFVEEVQIRRIDDQLEVKRPEDGEIITEIFNPSNTDPAQFSNTCPAGPPSTQFEGFWELNSDTERTFVDWGSDFITVYHFDSDNENSDSGCYEVSTYEIVSINRDIVRIKHTITGEEEELRAFFEDEVLVVQFTDQQGNVEEERYSRSDKTPDDITPVCQNSKQ